MSNDSDGCAKLTPLVKPLPFEHNYLNSRSPCNSAIPDQEFEGFPACHRLKCVVCGQEFWAKRPDRKYCSYRCNHKAAQNRERKKRQQQRFKKCLVCNQSFQAKSAKAVFCSLRHRVAYFRQRKRNDSKLRLNDHMVETVTNQSEEVS